MPLAACCSRRVPFPFIVTAVLRRTGAYGVVLFYGKKYPKTAGVLPPEDAGPPECVRYNGTARSYSGAVLGAVPAA